MGLYVIVVYAGLLISSLFIFGVVNHKVIKKHTKEVIHNDCYYLNPDEFKWNQKMDEKMKEEQGEDSNNDVTNIQLNHKTNDNLKIGI